MPTKRILHFQSEATTSNYPQWTYSIESTPWHRAEVTTRNAQSLHVISIGTCTAAVHPKQQYSHFTRDVHHNIQPKKKQCGDVSPRCARSGTSAGMSRTSRDSANPMCGTNCTCLSYAPRYLHSRDFDHCTKITHMAEIEVRDPRCDRFTSRNAKR